VENPSAGYCMPFLVVLAVALVTGLFSSTLDLFYGARLVAAAVALFFTRHYWRKDVIRRVSAAGPFWGVAVFALWIGFTPTNTDLASTLSKDLGELPDGARLAWLAARVLGTCAMAPIVEELAFRGFLQRRLMGSEFDLVPYAQVTVPCILVSALAFGALHPSLLLGTAAGVGYSLAARHRGGLSDAIVAHAVTNLLLTIWAFAFGRMDLLA
jgi:CAAX prenyl protease-like protein